MKIERILLLTLAFVAAPLLADDTVRIGKETKKTVGVLTAAESGDVACYLTLKDDRGVEFNELAVFEICETPSLIGKRVRLEYTLGNVMADECQGDPDCKKTRRVALVSKARVIGTKQTRSRR